LLDIVNELLVLTGWRKIDNVVTSLDHHPLSRPNRGGPGR